MNLPFHQFFTLLYLLTVIYACNGTSTIKQNSEIKDTGSSDIEHNDQYWKEILTPMEFYVLREKGTERAFTGDLWNHKEAGVYTCAGCSQALFLSDTKFKSGTGWPSFYQPVNKKSIDLDKDNILGYVRTEVLCSGCGGHLGHVFEDGPPPTGLRYCINSVALNFEKNK